MFHFSNLHEILNFLRKTMIVMATLFWKLQIVKDLVRPPSKKHCLRTPLHSQHVEGCQNNGKSAWEKFHHTFSSLWENVIWEIPPLVICEILGVFRKSLTANDKYPFRDPNNFLWPIEMQLSLKPKTLSDSFLPFLQSTSNFKQFEEKSWAS